MKEALVYTDKCQDVVGATTLSQSQFFCPGADGVSAEATWYRTAYNQLKDVLPAPTPLSVFRSTEQISEFPQVTAYLAECTSDSRHCILPSRHVCNRTVLHGSADGTATVFWPEWDHNAQKPCHRIDVSTREAPSVLYTDGDVDSMCYACSCSETDLNLNDSEYCTDFRSDYNSAFKWGIVAAILVVVVNQALRQVIVSAQPFLKKQTQEEEFEHKTLRCAPSRSRLLSVCGQKFWPFAS